MKAHRKKDPAQVPATDKIIRLLKSTKARIPLDDDLEEALVNLSPHEQLLIRRTLSNCHTKTVVEEVEDERTLGELLADRLAVFAGSWTFIIGFGCVLFAWMALNIVGLLGTFDPYPFILLNLVLSSLAALQAPVIMMSQNRQSKKDRRGAERDLDLSIKSELQNQEILEKLTMLLGRTGGTNENSL